MTGLIPHGKTPRQIGALVMWARRRDALPARGFTEAGFASMRAKAQRRVRTRGNQHTFQQKCKHGHSLADAYTYVRSGGIRQRQCRMCVRLSTIARAKRRREARVMPALKAAMLNAHPDKGGSTAKFLKARGAYLKAKAA